MNDLPATARAPLSSGAVPSTTNVSPMAPGGTRIAHNPANSPTDAMVNRLAEAERAVKDERRSQWLSMNQSSASSVLANLGAGGELPAHLRGADAQASTAANILAGGGAGASEKAAPNDALLRRISEVAVRRVARKRGVAVDAPQTKLVDDLFTVNVTYIDDGRVLDTPEALTQAFQQAIETEMALKGYDVAVEIVMFRSKDGATEKIGAEDEEEMFACEICDGLVKESDSKCPHCGAVFEEEDEEPAAAPAPSRSGPPGPGRSGGPRPEEKRSWWRSTRSEEGRSWWRSTRSEEGRSWWRSWWRSSRPEEGRSSWSKKGGPGGGPPGRRRAVLAAVLLVRRRAVLAAVLLVEEGRSWRRSSRSEERRSSRRPQERWPRWSSRSEEGRSWRRSSWSEEGWSSRRPQERWSWWPTRSKKSGPPGGPKRGPPGR